MSTPEHVREYNRKYYLKHRRKIIENNRQWRLKNPEYMKQVTKDRYATDPEKQHASDALCYARRKLRKHFDNPTLRFRDLEGFGE